MKAQVKQCIAGVELHAAGLRSRSTDEGGSVDALLVASCMLRGCA